MNAQDAYAEKIRTELGHVTAEVERLRARAAARAHRRDSRFDRYLDVLEAKCAGVGEALDPPNEGSPKDISKELKETKLRLAIAKRAARARFH